ncbi:MFS transporter [Dysgonomonas sp. 521]|uniref:hypothetical protein n=1 Tax=Dysgonomonas sp. 521 TaxID=2302932 RepID=UPI0013D09E8A|nr:hypothetical protein [Dysgonomonas sp. 521]NDV94268.1 MFS transporter [Dysgonomonas sp. 521]
MIPQGKYRIMAFKDFVPDWLRFTILLLLTLVFQFSNSIYLTNLNEVIGGKALTSEDVKLISAASFIGMTMIFPILFRIKFRFMSRTILLSAAAVIIVGNIISMYSNNVFILLVISFIVGAFKMIGTFECLSSIQLVITPKRDFTVFFSVVYLIVLGSIQISGLLTAEISYLFNWQYMHILIVGLQLIFMILIYFLMRPIRLMKKFPLYQIDWLGMGLWTLVLILSNFILEYGKRLDWLDSPYIRIAIVATLIFLICAIQRMFGIRRPFIMPDIFKYKNLMKALLLLIVLQIFLSTSSTILNVYIGGILHYDILHNTSLNWIVFFGVLLGAAFSFYWMSVYRGNYKTIFFIGFSAFVLHHFILYFIFQPGIAKEDLFLPYLLRGFGYVTLYIGIALYAAEGIPFPHFFPSLTLLGFVRTAVGGTMASSLCVNVLQALQKRNLMILSQNMDLVDPASNHVLQNTINQSIATGMTIEQAQVAATHTLYGLTNMQAMLLSWKEIFGGITLFGIIVLLGILFTPYMKPTFHQLPKLKNIWKYMWGKAYNKS